MKHLKPKLNGFVAMKKQPYGDIEISNGTMDQ